MNTAELRSHITHQLVGISDVDVLKEISVMLDLNSTATVYSCTKEQRQAIVQAQQAVHCGIGLSNEEVKQAAEQCLSES